VGGRRRRPHGEEVAVVLRAVAEYDAESGHHAAQRAPDHPYLARQLLEGDTWQIS
jgi:hypothetical protein